MIASITVSYQPDLGMLRKQLGSLCGQVQHMLVIDNGSSEHLLNGLRSLCHDMGASVYPLGSNTGIAHAQNIGIRAALAFGVDRILLLDQDSEATPDMVRLLSQALTDNPKAAAAGPSTVDQRTGRRSFFVRDIGFWPTRWEPLDSSKSAPIEVGFLIASGTLLRSTAVDNAMPMRDTWFIDHIDTEWCLRIRAQGWTLLGVAQAQLQHRLGDKVSQIWWLRTRQVAHHSPLRDYYMFRNSILLCALPTTPWRWKLYFLTRLVQFAGYFLSFAPQRTLRLRRMVQGVFNGLKGRTGPYQ